MLEGRPSNLSELRELFGEVRISDLRRLYGKPFAQGFHDRTKLKNALKLMDSISLKRLARDPHQGS